MTKAVGCALCHESGHAARSRSGRILCPKFAAPPTPQQARERARGLARLSSAAPSAETHKGCRHNCFTRKTVHARWLVVCDCCGTTAPRGEDSVLIGLCCLVDPRACPNPKHIGRRIAGNWCLWCGEDEMPDGSPLPEGQAFCSKPCSTSFAADVGCTLREPMRTVALPEGCSMAGVGMG